LLPGLERGSEPNESDIHGKWDRPSKPEAFVGVGAHGIGTGREALFQGSFSPGFLYLRQLLLHGTGHRTPGKEKGGAGLAALQGREDSDLRTRGSGLPPSPCHCPVQGTWPSWPSFALKQALLSSSVERLVWVAAPAGGRGEEREGICGDMLTESCLLSLQVGFDPHPPMRATGLPSSLASIPGGKP
jgi:hypothetical protein